MAPRFRRLTVCVVALVVSITSRTAVGSTGGNPRAVNTLAVLEIVAMSVATSVLVPDLEPLGGPPRAASGIIGGV
jgi:hypothetical protein